MSASPELSSLLARASALIGNETALLWLDRPLQAFGGLTPRQLTAEGYTEPLLRHLHGDIDAELRAVP